MRERNILVTGGAGYIGSHMVRALLEQGCAPIVFDNLSTGHREFVPKGVPFIKGDLLKASQVESVFKKFKPRAVIHFAASSFVGESVQNPLKYYENNVSAFVNLLKSVTKHKVKNIIFSSTCAIFGEPKKMPIEEEDEKNPVNPYGRSKLMIERILQDLSDKGELRYAALRYFNACGALRAGGLGEWHDPETHLIPNILKAALDKKKEITVFGEDYDTPDGTCVRDYIHVEDLCEAHVLALGRLEKGEKSDVFNLGSGEGYSVKQVIEAAKQVTGKPIRVKIGPRRPGDPPRLIAGSSKALKILGWRPRIFLKEILETAWRWETSR